MVLTNEKRRWRSHLRHWTVYRQWCTRKRLSVVASTPSIEWVGSRCDRLAQFLTAIGEEGLGTVLDDDGGL